MGPTRSGGCQRGKFTVIKGIVAAVSALVLSAGLVIVSGLSPANAASTLSITSPTSLYQGTTGLHYSVALEAAGGTTPYTWSATGLPPGLSVISGNPPNNTVWLLNGTPTTAGSYSVSFTVSDSSSPVQYQYLTLPLTIVEANPPLTITSAIPGDQITPLTEGQISQSYSDALSASGGTPPYTWSLIDDSSLPQGLSLAPSTGAITGTPVLSDGGLSHSFIIQVADSASDTAVDEFSIAVAALPSTTSSTPSSSSFLLGGSVSDTATVTGNATGGSPAGSVSFYECGPTTTPEPCTSQANPVGSAVNITAGPDDTSTATSESITPSAAGYWCFGADYPFSNGDGYSSSSDDSTDECVDVEPAASSTITTPAASTIALGQSDTDGATVTGIAAGGSPTGSVSFYECGPTATPQPCTSQANQVGGTVGVTAAADNTSTASSASFTPTTQGYWCFAGVYSGDEQLQRKFGRHHRRMRGCDGRHHDDG